MINNDYIPTYKPSMSLRFTVGDKFTLPNKFKKRTFLELMLNKPKELQQFVITDTISSMSEFKPLACPDE